MEFSALGYRFAKLDVVLNVRSIDALGKLIYDGEVSRISLEEKRFTVPRIPLGNNGKLPFAVSRRRE